ncbi:hypothetical protein LOK49_LG10G00267 [Camellia lanceoleosa]|uniref:Uncharacterized protein n=1 Tax=Camellia lanceoleosa TaxID=1840588 RepID=A0ACC0GHQ2_9ERIC|nr:hypothetical protein LOK49_LG10G00267 [Camellia lanceoleosa]
MVTVKIQDPVAILPHSEKQPVLSSLDILDYKSNVHATADEVMDDASNKLDNLQTISTDFVSFVVAAIIVCQLMLPFFVVATAVVHQLMLP